MAHAGVAPYQRIKREDLMPTFIQPTFILVLFVCIRAGDLAITASVAKDTLRAILYGITAILALVAIIIMLFHL